MDFGHDIISLRVSFSEDENLNECLHKDLLYIIFKYVSIFQTDKYSYPFAFSNYKWMRRVQTMYVFFFCRELLSN